MLGNIRKIKIAMVTNHFGVTGISTVILNYCKALNPNKYDLTIIAGSPIAVQNAKVCVQYGIKLIEIPSRHQEFAAHYFRLWQAMRSNKYDIVHIHGSSSMMAIELTLARLANEKLCIAHSHNSACPNMKIHKILNPYFRRAYTKALACGVLAGDWLFGENQFEVLPNGFHTVQFRFDEVEREKIRRELHLEARFIIGHIGRFNEQKNQPYLLKIFEKIAEKRSDAELLLVGTGPDFEKMKALVEIHPYKNRIILYGEISHTSAMYSAMDVFVLPSRHEGLPVVLLEAQISGLPCVVSNKITKEMDFGNILWESIDDDPMLWADIICGIKPLAASERTEYFKAHQRQIVEYDIERTVKQLENIYEFIHEQVSG